MIEFNPVIEDDPNFDLEFPATMLPLIIKSSGEKLLGTFFSVSGKEKKPLLFLLHGFPGNETNYDIAHAIRRFGINVVVFHYRGSWGSGGSFSIGNSLEDVSAAIDYFNDEAIANQYNVDNKKIILAGHSMGGFLAMLTSLRYKKINNIAFLAGFNFGYFGEFLTENPQYKDITLEGLEDGPKFLRNSSAEKIYNEMIENMNNWNLLNHLHEFKDKNILLIGGENDEVAPLQLHHFPLVDGLNKAGVKIKSSVFKTGHSFASTRIKLTTEIINWLKKIDYERKYK